MKLLTRQYCQLIVMYKVMLLFNSLNLGIALEYPYTASFQAETFNYAKNVGVLVFHQKFNSSKVQQGFQQFVSYFNVDLNNIKIEFLQHDGINGLIRHLQITKHNIIIVQNFNEFISKEETSGIYLKGANYCHLGQLLSNDFNKTVIFWPCPRFKESYSYLPSFEAVSYAVKSIANKLNWTEVEIYVEDENCGLALIISSNLLINYRIKMINHLEKEDQLIDKVGKGIIITTTLNNIATVKALLFLKPLIYTKVLLIDIVALSFNINNKFYQNLILNNIVSNLLILTVLSDKYRHFINVALNNTGMDNVQNFRKTRWLSELESTHFNLNMSWFRLYKENQNNHNLIKLCEHLRNNVIASRTINSLVHICNKTLKYLKNCESVIDIKDVSLLKIEYMKNCKFIDIKSTVIDSTNDDVVNINALKNYTNLFNFYDFIIASILTNESIQTKINNSDLVKYDFVVLDVATNSNTYSSNLQHATKISWRPLFILEKNELNENSFTTHSILPGYDDWLIVNTSTIWNCQAVCWTILGTTIIFLICIVGISVAAGVAVRNYFLRKRLSKGPNKIVLSASDFVFPVDARRVDEGIEAMLCCWLQQLQEFGGPEVDKPDILKGSIGSLKNLGLAIAGKNNSGSGSLAKHNSTYVDMRARYNGDLVQLKEIPLIGSNELKSKAMDFLVMAHGLRHENINPLIGWLSDPNRTAMVFDYCSRGSLQDVLIMDEIKLDWSFRLSLLTDLVRGMRYLHASSIRVHGSLTSRNCVVDARWVLKITDYNVLTFYEAQSLSPPLKNPKELLWTAPELLRNTKGHNKIGTQLGDVYSFGIIMQEVVVRGEPYCMLSLSPEEIISKIKKPPPLIRPSVSKGAAPPEAINIMRQCWAEMPDMRPDFNSVYERFKMLNHGRKVNFVDTMFQMLEKYSNNLEELIRERTEQLDIERKKTEQLLNRMLPSSVAEKLKLGLAVDPEEFSDVTIYFSDIVGFTTIAAHCSPVQVVDLLNDLYTIFDATINAYNVYKVETIGDAYMVVSGLPQKNPDHAVQIATMALDLLHQSGRFKVKHLPGVPLQLRIGLHTGPCCAGVVGLTMPRYCLFGDTVNTASRMESSGSSWRIHMSQVTRDCLENAGGYIIESRGLTEIKGKGLMNTYWLLGKTGFEKILPIPPPIGESHGLDETLIRNSISLKAKISKSCNSSTNPSSSQSSLIANDPVEVKVEITPPHHIEVNILQPHPYSLDSNSTNTISPNHNLNMDFSRTTNIHPQSRKTSELSPESILNSNNYNRLSSTTGSSSRLYKKIEEMIDLSSPYNHYKCLSPSENNITQCTDAKYLYNSGKLSENKPGSSRLLRRQFSLDKDDCPSQSTQIIQGLLDIPILQDNRCVKGQIARLHKQNSHSIAQDLEKIEEIPLSPVSSQQHSSLDSTINRSSTASNNGIGTFSFEENNENVSKALIGTTKENVHTQEITLNVETLLSS